MLNLKKRIFLGKYRKYLYIISIALFFSKKCYANFELIPAQKHIHVKIVTIFKSDVLFSKNKIYFIIM